MKTLGPSLSNPHEMNDGPEKDRALANEPAELRATLILDRGTIRSADSGKIFGQLSGCSVRFANELLFRYDAYDELVATLRAVQHAQRTGTYAEAFAKVDAALVKVDG